MADNKTTVALEIGAQSVTMGVFTPAKRGFTLTRYARREILLDPVEEGMRMDYVSNAIAEMVKELKLKGSEVHNVVSGQQVFMRFIKLPDIGMDDLSEQVGYEAQQHIPFPLEDIIYDYQELAAREEGEREVLLVAIKKDVLDTLNAQVEECGVKTRAVDCSITSLYNAFRVSYPDENEPVMLLDIGAKTTDIIFADAGHFFTRSVTAAGAFVTNAISRELRIGFREAEALKVESGMISLGNGHTDGMSEQEATLATIIRNAMQRLSSEVLRTINHYRAQYKGNAPVRAYICGGGARMPFITEFLESALNIPVEFMNPLAAFGVGKKVSQEELAMDSLCLGPVAGAAVTGAKAGEFSIDLVPTSVGRERAELQMLPKVALAGLIALAGAGFYAYSADTAATAAERNLAKARPAYEAAQEMESRIENVQGKYQRTMRELTALADVYAQRTAYVDVLKQLSEKATSTKYWFTEFSPLINYNVDNTLLEGTDVKGTRLIDLNRSTNAVSASALNQAPESADTRRKDDAPKVTAIYVTGFTTKKPGDTKSTAQQEAVRDMVRTNFDERSADSLFDYSSQKMTANGNHYFRFLDAKESKGKLQIPDYVEKFMMVMPLKTPIPIPQLEAAGKR